MWYTVMMSNITEMQTNEWQTCCHETHKSFKNQQSNMEFLQVSVSTYWHDRKYFQKRRLPDFYLLSNHVIAKGM